ncbi:CoA ester lyase [Corynebacterium pyruviciproducens]|uniref:HpcH/HpaI aldolase/citrate lyase family protein n=1 Tax=Corynebacterium pyruviciproducens TaxID=598660 RepID=UPI002456D496|nr:CoA ester lyase [Corynebacterium pyruviciproducens]MDH4658639.1 CoA ester lyase [Corynebacterium pyruviciproducens]
MTNENIILGPAIMFVPCNRPERFEKGIQRADMIILDLEDGAGAEHDEQAREEARQNLIYSNLDPAHVIVRINGPEAPGFLEDLEAYKKSGYGPLIVPMLRERIPPEVEDLPIIALIETPQALVHVNEIAAHPDVIGLYWGAEDLTIELGGTHSRYQEDESNRPTHLYRDMIQVARTMVHVAAAAHGKFTIDASFADFSDPEGQYREAVDAARIGFAATATIHPAQTEPVRRAYLPDEETLTWARRVVEESYNHPGPFKLDGQMCDAPLIKQAFRIARRAGDSV